MTGAYLSAGRRPADTNLLAAVGRSQSQDPRPCVARCFSAVVLHNPSPLLDRPASSRIASIAVTNGRLDAGLALGRLVIRSPPPAHGGRVSRNRSAAWRRRRSPRPAPSGGLVHDIHAPPGPPDTQRIGVDYRRPWIRVPGSRSSSHGSGPRPHHRQYARSAAATMGRNPAAETCPRHLAGQNGARCLHPDRTHPRPAAIRDAESLVRVRGYHHPAQIPGRASRPSRSCWRRRIDTAPWAWVITQTLASPSPRGHASRDR